MLPRTLIATLLAVMAPAAAAWAQTAEPKHGISMYGDLKYPPDFANYDYADPAAPKGGAVVYSVVGTTFDSTNPFILKGVPGAGSASIYDTLTDQATDEPFTEYGLLAKTITVAPDRSFVEYELRPEAKWHDGVPITPEDVIFSFETLKTKGAPFYRAYYSNVKSAEKVGEHGVRFTFDGTPNRELALIMGQLVVLPKHYWEGRDFEKPSLDIPLGSGPYRIKAIDPGRAVTLERVPDYWGKDIPVNRGRYNYDTIRYDYYRDANVALEAFKAGQYDWRGESSAKAWATGYTGPAVEKGLIKLEEIPQQGGGGMQGFVFNTRRDLFKDPRVRDALAYAFDFEWTKKNLFYGQYTRTTSYFANTELASSGLPSPAEVALLEPFRDKLPAEVFTTEYQPPVTDGTGNNRDQLRKAIEILKGAGWEVRDKRMVEVATGKPMEFEILLDSPLFERIAGPFVKSLERLGIKATIRTVDTAQYQQRIDSFDFDMAVGLWGQSLSPGNEQRDFWGSASATQNGSRNLAGIADPVVDALIDKIIQAQTREQLTTAVRALDRVLLWGHYVIPQWHSATTRLARWDKFGHPAVLPIYGLDPSFWWIDPAKATALAQAKSGLPATPPAAN